MPNGEKTQRWNERRAERDRLEAAGDHAGASRIQHDEINPLAAEVLWPRRSQQSRGRRGGRRGAARQGPNLVQRVSSARDRQRRYLRQHPEIELEEKLEEQRSGRLHRPPIAAELMQTAREEVFRTYAFRWQKTPRDLGGRDTDVRGDEPPAI